MLKKYQLFNVSFGLIFLFQIFVGFKNLNELHYFTRPLVYLVLLVALYHYTNLSGRFHKRIFIGLILALIGDVLFTFQSDKPYVFVFYLLSHIFYIRAFVLDHQSNPTLKNKYFLPALLGFGLFCAGFVVLLSPYLGVMKLPALVYAFVISFMAITTVNRFGKVNAESFKLVFIGAVFFLISDSIFAYNRFVSAIYLSDAWIMATYMIAQYLITLGTIKRELLVKATEV